MTPAEATAMQGQHVGEQEPTIPSPRPGETITVKDQDTGETIGIVTALGTAWRTRLRAAVRGMGMGTVARMSGRMSGGGTTFGWQPRRVVNGRESCRAANSATLFPGAHKTLTDLSLSLADQFAALLPERAEQDRATISKIVRPEWMLEEESLWTSGVVNKTAQLPYHRDGMNFHTWSAMPSLRYGMDGGHLHLPEYDITYTVGDGDVTWFCGKDLLHGVTPMRVRKNTKDAYRYTIVYYALRGMKDCATYAIETGHSQSRRTQREQRMAGVNEKHQN